MISGDIWNEWSNTLLDEVFKCRADVDSYDDLVLKKIFRREAMLFEALSGVMGEITERWRKGKIPPDEYQERALRTVREPRNDILQEALMGLAGESGEAIDILKKHLYQGHELDKEQLALELGDVSWYLAVAADAIGYDLGKIFRMNLEKLQKRYPYGFDPERSVNRQD